MKESILGIHVTLDLGHGLRIGPDHHYIDRGDFDYSVDILERKFFEFYNKILTLFKKGGFTP